MATTIQAQGRPASRPRNRPFSASIQHRTELPQLWSVVIGEMSLVGPRPFPSYHLDEFGEQFRELRRRVRPGLTGLWQVMIRGEGGIREQESYDTYYIRNWSLWMDCYLLTRTLAAVIRGRNLPPGR